MQWMRIELSEAAHHVKNTVGESEEGITYIAGDLGDERLVHL